MNDIFLFVEFVIRDNGFDLYGGVIGVDFSIELGIIGHDDDNERYRRFKLFFKCNSINESSDVNGF